MQKKFVDHYLDDCHFDASKAARAAGYSARSAGQTGYRLKNDEKIAAYIEAQLNERGLTKGETLWLLREDATATDDQILALANQASSPPVAAAIVSSKMSARTSARQSFAKAHKITNDQLGTDGTLLVTQVVVVHEGTGA